MLDKIRSHALKVTHSIIAEWTLSKLVFHINYISTRNNPLTNNIQLVRWTLNFLEVKWRRFTIYLMHCLNYPKTFFLWFLLFQPVDPIEPRTYIISEGRNHVHCFKNTFCSSETVLPRAVLMAVALNWQGGSWNWTCTHNFFLCSVRSLAKKLRCILGEKKLGGLSGYPGRKKATIKALTFDIAVIDLTVDYAFFLLSSIFFSLCFLVLVASTI